MWQRTCWVVFTRHMNDGPNEINDRHCRWFDMQWMDAVFICARSDSWCNRELCCEYRHVKLVFSGVFDLLRWPKFKSCHPNRKCEYQNGFGSFIYHLLWDFSAQFGSQSSLHFARMRREQTFNSATFDSDWQSNTEHTHYTRIVRFLFHSLYLFSSNAVVYDVENDSCWWRQRSQRRLTSIQPVLDAFTSFSKRFNHIRVCTHACVCVHFILTCTSGGDRTNLRVEICLVLPLNWWLMCIGILLFCFAAVIHTSQS